MTVERWGFSKKCEQLIVAGTVRPAITVDIIFT